MSDVLSTVIDIGTIIFAAIAVGISIAAYKNAKKGQQFNIVDKFLTELGQLDIEVANLHRMYDEKELQIIRNLFGSNACKIIQ